MTVAKWPAYAWALLVAVAAFALFTRHNDFPYYYHPDEPGKVRQVLSGEWNYHHPMLLLVTTKALLPHDASLDDQLVVERGRAASAGFSAIAIAALSLLGWRWRGPAGGIAVGLLLLTHHQLFELSHYMKEDTALLAGIALAFLALDSYQRAPGPTTALLLGGACGFATSGKYIGVVMIPLGLILTLTRPEQKRLRDTALLFAGAAAVFALLNWPMLSHLAAFQSSFGREMEYVVEGQKGSTRSVPHTEYLSAFRDNTTPGIWLLLAACVALFVIRKRRESLAAWITFLFPFAFTLALSFSPKTNDRYFLPATALFVFLAGVAASPAATWIWQRIRKTAGAEAPGWLTVSTIAIAVLLNVLCLPNPLDWPTLSEYVRAFQTDDRADLRGWVLANLPGDAVLAQDSRAGLPVTDAREDVARRQQPIPQRVLGRKNAAALGTLDELRQKGVSYVIASQSDYGRYFRESIKPKEGAEEGFQRSRAFYEQLFREGKLVWKRDRGAVIYLHPGIEVYSIQGS